MRKIPLALGLGGLAILGGVLIFRAPSPVSAPSAETNETLPIPSAAHLSLPPPVTKVETPTEVAAAPAELKVFESKKELEEYELLNKKIFLSPAEKTQKQALLKNEKFIAQLQDLFRVPVKYTDSENQQNAAVDFLLEALSGESSAAAAEVLKSIIEDPSTENESLSPAARENLAGVKAEVLYKWSAQEPLKASEMERWLPGPVSQKIWKNVLSQQEMNRAESALTK